MIPVGLFYALLSSLSALDNGRGSIKCRPRFIELSCVQADQTFDLALCLSDKDDYFDVCVFTTGDKIRAMQHVLHALGTTLFTRWTSVDLKPMLVCPLCCCREEGKDSVHCEERSQRSIRAALDQDHFVCQRTSTNVPICDVLPFDGV